MLPDAVEAGLLAGGSSASITTSVDGATTNKPPNVPQPPATPPTDPFDWRPLDFIAVRTAQRRQLLRNVGRLGNSDLPVTPVHAAKELIEKWQKWVLIRVPVILGRVQAAQNSARITSAFERIEDACSFTHWRAHLSGFILDNTATFAFWNALSDISLVLMDAPGTSREEYGEVIIQGIKEGVDNLADATEGAANAMGEAAGHAANQIGKVIGEGVSGVVESIGLPGLVVGGAVIYVMVNGSPV